MKIYLATFYSSDLKRSATRFKHQAEAMRIFEASMPSAVVVSAHALPQNYK